MPMLFYTTELLDGFENTADHALRRLPDLMREAGFDNIVERFHWETPFGMLVLRRATKPRTAPDHPVAMSAGNTA